MWGLVERKCNWGLWGLDRCGWTSESGVGVFEGVELVYLVSVGG